MALDLLRSTDVLSGADALLPSNADTLIHSTDASASGVLPSSGALNVSNDLTPVTDIANDAILALHAQLEGTADANGVAGAVHGVTNLGETLGLGKIGDANLVTTALQLPTALAGGDPSTLGQVAPDLLAVAGAANQLATGALGDAGTNPALLAPIGQLAAAAQGLGTTPLAAAANDTVLGLHATLEGASDASGVAGTVHGITGLGETVGLGKIGGANLVTDALDTPQSLLSGNLDTVTHVPADVGAIAGAAQNLVSGALSDVASGTLLSNPVGNAVNLATGLAALPVTMIANDAIDGFHLSLENAGDPLASGTLHGVIGVGNSIGLGTLGGDNILSDALATPGALLGGDTTPLTHLPADVGTIGSALAAVPGALAGDLGSSGLVDALTHPATGGGLLGGNLPAGGILDTVTSTLGQAVDGGTGAAGLGRIGQSLGGALGGAQGGLLHDVVQVPGDLIGGAGAAGAPVTGDAGGALASAGSILGSVAATATQALGGADAGGILGPGVGALSGPVETASHLAGGALDAATSVMSGASSPTTGAGLGGLAGAATGILGGTSAGSGTSDLATVSVGGQAAINVLPSDGSGLHLASVTSAGTAAAAPALANVAVLPDGLALPPATGGGLDALSGIVSQVVSSTGGAAGAAHAPVAGLDLGIAHVDLPVAHAEPLAGLAHAV